MILTTNCTFVLKRFKCHLKLCILLPNCISVHCDTTMSQQVEFLNENSSLNRGFFEKVLKKKYDTEAIVLKDFTFDATTEVNYGIQVTRVRLYYSFSGNENMDIVCRTFVIKSLLNDTDSDGFLRSNALISKEAIFYLDILPQLYDIMDNDIVDGKLAPRCLAAEAESSFLVFEDLSKKGYRKVGKWSGLDFDHLKICLSKLAKLHSVSACYGYKDPPLLKIFKHSPVTSEKPERFQYFEQPIRTCADVSRSWAGFEEISKKLYDLLPNIVEKTMNLFKPSKFNVIIHGDLWSNNLMYLYDKDEMPIDVIMLDYSSAYWGSPTIDLQYLLYSSSSNDLGSEKFYELIEYYHHELTKNLSILKYPGDIPSLDDINEDIFTNSVPIIGITTLVNGFRLTENATNAKEFSIVESSSFLIKLMSTGSYRNRMEFLLNYYDSMGFLD